MDWQLLTQLLVAGGVGGILANYVSSTSGRRESRLYMLKCLRELGEPHAHHNPAEEAQFLDAVLSAGAPRALAELLLRARIAAVMAEALARGIESRPARAAEGVTFETAMARMTQAQRARAVLNSTLVQYAWHPWWTILTWRITTFRARASL